ncbi:ABC transporter substrate-binding protein [Bordetella genomosp. 5]|uniref:ABC transporter substrate-binding protein n=1 Tax=Bordetella genomosp. 5 TaxID=1395608 RepID=A0A261TXF8_9BORD|nr:ABC transporter substrate-binding protein [Bordetella genomosp. 5]OZI44747.1 ABC transporter substrate-binding protein [Bordetella genomosp. 5]OZI53680.1 ABC transporter substrate-binding protein [Bordetella genomosp. 5]
MKHRLLNTLAAALLAASASAGVHAESLSIGFADPLSSLDPQLNNHAGDRSVALHFWDLLVENKWNKLQPGLALSWKPLDDKTWEFKLRPNVKWQDGQPFTADDLIYSYTRAKAVPGSVATYAGYLRTIESMSAPDPLTFVVKTKAPNPDLPLNLASVHVVSKHVGEKSSTEDYNSGKAMIGTGPYKFVSYTPGDRVLMERNDAYWGDKQIWEKVNYRYINNAASRTAALLAGDVDVIDKVSVSDLERLSKAPNISVYPYAGLRVMLLQPSFSDKPSQYITDKNGKPLDKNPLLDVRVRQALNLAINRKAIVDRVLQDAATEANQWMPEGTFGYNPDIKNIPFDAAQAKKLLAEAGYPDGFQLTMHVPNDRYPQGPETAQAVAQFWTRIGVKTNVEVVPWAVYSGRANKNEFAMSMLAWGNGTGEASYALVNILATVDPSKGLGASNWGRYSNAKVDQALDQSTSEFDVPKREAILRESAKVVSEDAGILPLFHYKNIWATKKGLKVTPMTSDRTAAQMVTKVAK